MGLNATVYRNPKNLTDYLRERVIVDSASGAIDLRDPADERIFGKSKLGHGLSALETLR